MTWSKEWPTVPGWYWAHGYLSRVRERRTGLVRVELDANKHPVRVWGGMLLYPSECGDVRWTPATLPDPPTDIEEPGDDPAG